MSEHGPTVFGGRYELHRRLARGGMADVYLARDQLLDRPVAVKVLFAEFATDPTFVERFRREAQAAANLNHPNIVSIYDWGEEAGTYYIVMEYVEGKSLAQLIRQEGRLHPDRASDIASEVASALGFAHSKSLAHRDVKPGNVLMSSKGEIKVADFGIATAMVGGADNNLTQTGAVMGTATYFSPEQAQGKPVDPRSDLYSLGVVLYEMLVGSPPFTGETPVSIAYKHVQEAPVPPGERGVDVPEALAAITMKLLAKNPSNRYPTSDDLRADLRRYRSGAYSGPDVAALATAAQPTTAMPANAMPANAMPAGAPAGADMAAGTQVLPQAASYGPPPERSRTGLIVGGFIVVLLGLIGLVVALLSAFSGDDPGEVTAEPVPEQARIVSVSQMGEVEAIRTLESDGFVVAQVLRQTSETVPEGLVISQDPRGGLVADFGSDVTITISAGRAPEVIPDVVGNLQRDGERILEEAGFVVSVIQASDDEVLEGNIISQDPRAADERAPGSTVTIIVSEGPGEVPVPDVSDLTFEAAKERLELLGFQVAREDEASNDFAVDAIIRTEPASGEDAAEAAVIRVFVSTGTPVAALPSVTGLRRIDAKSELELRGYVVVEQFSPQPDISQVDLVLVQQPAANTQVENGATVTLTIGILAEATATPIPPTPIPTLVPTPIPTLVPTPIPTLVPTPIPTLAPTATATPVPLPATPIPATAVPTLAPATAVPTVIVEATAAPAG